MWQIKILREKKVKLKNGKIRQKIKISIGNVHGIAHLAI